ncbi:AT-hook motif nuclear-localized protein 9 [Brachypodium distachyon]|uniref:AT-hook motif nuclear-localized protein n=1 Tax=Brachypodium distachyon TaxID=15368 RepID=I1J3J0_BRADI|nr:AT-hook motif nuclear-localized protein 9 [Brachypodium distachyon]KQJ85386.1 hypothetical protein BRADI_5g26720v3 [Brachypodium distachyon]|eukprot:XP_003580851.1 AT-hook motif nuclear-localized protein 9 [Brachypodium distachyon]
MDGKDHLIAPSDLPQFYAAQQQQQQHHHRMLSNAGQQVSQASPLSGGMHHSVIRPMPNMSMSPTAILQSIGGAQMPPFHTMDAAPSPSSMMQHGGGAMGGSGVSGPGTATAMASPPEPVKRKRGRPRKYGPDGAMNKMSSSSLSSSHHQQQMMGAPPPRLGSLDMVGGMDVDAANKKRRGRPPGTGKKLSSPTKKPSGNAFSGSAGTSFTPHIITASPSEDVAGKIAAFATQSPRAVCVLSAMGSVSRVVLRHPADHASSVSRAPPSYNNPAIYEGLYEILSLSGSYNLNEDQQNQSDGISVTLCSPERHVIGGVLGGALVAASTVQVVLGSFVHGGSRAKSKKSGKQPNFGFDSLSGGGTDASPSSGHNQNLTPPSVVTTTGGWPSSGIFDTRSSNIDINSSRG